MSDKEKIAAVDAHHHLWDLEANRYPWLISDPDTPGSGGFPHAIVAWADLSQTNVEGILEGHCDSANVRGVRQMLNDTPKPTPKPVKSVEVENANLLEKHGNLLRNQTFLQQFSLLRKYDLSFDMQIFPWQTREGSRLVAAHPDTAFILNHTIMPFDRSEAGLEIWRDAPATYAGFPNAVLKVSGLGMAPGGWNPAMNRRLVREAIEVFGPARCLFASNFPVDKLMSDYDAVWNLFRDVVSDLSPIEQAAMLRTNAERVYRI